MFALRIAVILLLAFSSLPVLAKDDSFSTTSVASGFRTNRRPGREAPGVYVTVQSYDYDENYGKQYDRYKRRCVGKIGRTWSPRVRFCRQEPFIQVKCKLNPDGSIEDARLVLSTGVQAADCDALDAVKKSAPFGPFPEAFPKKKLDALFTISYSAFGDEWSAMEIIEDTDFSQYSCEIAKRLAASWIVPTTDRDTSSFVCFTVNRSGRSGNVELMRTSLISNIDQSAISASKLVNQFSIPPKGAPEKLYVIAEFRVAP